MLGKTALYLYFGRFAQGYPVNDERNGQLLAQYKQLAKKETKTVFGGRLGEYKYYDMDQVVASALQCVNREIGEIIC